MARLDYDIDGFVRAARMLAEGQHVVVGPSVAHPEFELVVTARQPGDFECYHYTMPFDETWAGVDRRQAVDFLVALLRRDFDIVERTYDDREFAQAISRCWPPEMKKPPEGGSPVP
jgi:hypothetical protein